MTKQNWDNYHKNYYYKNRDKINAQRRVRSILQSRRYYEEHKEEILAKQKAKRVALKLVQIKKEQGQPDLFENQVLESQRMTKPSRHTTIV